MVQLTLVMGDMKDQKAALEARDNIKETWQEMINLAKVEDRDEKLELDELRDPTSPVTALILYIY